MQIANSAIATTTTQPSELFISYAVEDAPFVQWLAAKLVLMGYHVWWDRTRLLGGAAFPKEIDNAIKHRAARVLAVMSESSLNKPNPERERQLALNVGQQRRLELLIPLNLNISRESLCSQVSNLTAIQFDENWAKGLRDLVETLREGGVPCDRADGSLALEQLSSTPPSVEAGPEPTWLNLFAISDLPTGVARYEWPGDITDGAVRDWPNFVEDRRIRWGFEAPPDVPGMGKPARDQYATSTRTPPKGPRGLKMKDICASLVRQYVERHCLRCGLVRMNDGRSFYFPDSHPKASRLPFALPQGRNTWLRPIGYCKVRQSTGLERLRHHLAIFPRVELARFGSPVLQIVPSLWFTSENGALVDPLKNTRRAKAVRRKWYNDKWLARVAALGHFLADGAPSWALAESLAAKVAGVPLTLISPIKLNDGLPSESDQLAADGQETAPDDHDVEIYIDEEDGDDDE